MRLASRPAIRVAVAGSYLEAVQGLELFKAGVPAQTVPPQVVQDRLTQEHSGGVVLGLNGDVGLTLLGHVCKMDVP